MTKVVLNPIFARMSGQVGDLVLRKYNGGTILARKADTENLKWTPAQLQHRQQFGQAIRYGKMAMADTAARAVYQAEAASRKKPIFSLMVADYFNAPVVNAISLHAYHGAANDRIIINAHDDFSVARVMVEIRLQDGTVIERGEAAETPAGSEQWQYTAQTDAPAGVSVQVIAQAFDRPGGMGQLEARHVL